MKKFLVGWGRKIWQRKILWGLVFLAVAGVIYFDYYRSKGTEEEGLKTATVERGNMEITVTGTGQVQAESQVDLKGVKAGDGIDVVEVAVKNDQAVKKGDLIVVLDTTDPMKSVRNAQLSLETALISQKETVREFDNQTVEEKWKRQTQEIAVEQKRVALSDALSDLEDYYIRAPFDGVVTGLDVEPGDSVSQSDVIASVITREMQAEITLNEVDAAKVKEGNEVKLVFDALAGVAMKGKVNKIDTIGEVVQNVVSYAVEISFQSTSDLLKPGMSVDVEILIDSRENVLQIPSSAVKTNRDGSHYVQLIDKTMDQHSAEGDDFGIRKQAVEIGLTDDVMTEIVSGLEEGEVVVTKMNISSVGKTDEDAPAGLLDSARMGGTRRR